MLSLFWVGLVTVAVGWATGTVLLGACLGIPYLAVLAFNGLCGGIIGWFAPPLHRHLSVRRAAKKAKADWPWRCVRCGFERDNVIVREVTFSTWCHCGGELKQVPPSNPRESLCKLVEGYQPHMDDDSIFLEKARSEDRQRNPATTWVPPSKMLPLELGYEPYLVLVKASEHNERYGTSIADWWQVCWRPKSKAKAFDDFVDDAAPRYGPGMASVLNLSDIVVGKTIWITDDNDKSQGIVARRAFVGDVSLEYGSLGGGSILTQVQMGLVMTQNSGDASKGM